VELRTDELKKKHNDIHSNREKNIKVHLRHMNDKHANSNPKEQNFENLSYGSKDRILKYLLFTQTAWKSGIFTANVVNGILEYYASAEFKGKKVLQLFLDRPKNAGYINEKIKKYHTFIEEVLDRRISSNDKKKRSTENVTEENLSSLFESFNFAEITSNLIRDVKVEKKLTKV
jgi:hypothetical protein